MAAAVLENVERRYDNTVQAICICNGIDPFVTKPHKIFIELVNEGDTGILFTYKVAHCVRYLSQEAFCAPPILHLEMVRGVGDDIQHRDPNEPVWMEWGVVDSRPFLHYLQYLTFRDLGLRHKQIQAFDALRTSILDGRRRHQVFHYETATNLFAHCLEMEGRIGDALGFYLASQADMPRNNAANLHIRKLANIL